MKSTDRGNPVIGLSNLALRIQEGFEDDPQAILNDLDVIRQTVSALTSLSRTRVTLRTAVEIEIELPNGHYAYVTWKQLTVGEGLVIRGEQGRAVQQRCTRTETVP